MATAARSAGRRWMFVLSSGPAYAHAHRPSPRPQLQANEKAARSVGRGPRGAAQKGPRPDDPRPTSPRARRTGGDAFRRGGAADMRGAHGGTRRRCVGRARAKRAGTRPRGWRAARACSANDAMQAATIERTQPPTRITRRVIRGRIVVAARGRNLRKGAPRRPLPAPRRRRRRRQHNKRRSARARPTRRSKPAI